MKKVFLFAALAAMAVAACTKPQFVTPEGSVLEDGTKVQYAKGLVIEEIYYTSSPVEGKDSSDDDQYIKLTNTSSETIYADRVMFVSQYVDGFITSTGAYYTYPELPDGLVVTDMFMIPGNGKEHPIPAGGSIVLAIHANNYAEENPNAVDLSKADFEFYDGENEFFSDTDNPDVPNLDVWFKSSFTITLFHHRGLESFAIVRVPEGETAENIMTNRHWSGEKHMIFNEYDFVNDIAEDDAFVIPADWVLDAVNCTTKDSYYQNPWGPKFDAGWTGVGDFSDDVDSYGKSVARKVVDGKLIDSNNSTNDFKVSTPSLK